MRHHSFCRACFNFCPVVVDVEDGQLVRVTGDRENEIFGGYTCIKGRAQPSIVHRPDRLLHSRRRRSDGTFEPISSVTAIEEIAERLTTIIDRAGPRAVASYMGTGVAASAAMIPFISGLMRAIGSPMTFTTNTIDKPGRDTAPTLLGRWSAPLQGWHQPEVALLIGANPFQSYFGVACGNPATWLGERMRAGMKLIVVDPRRTDIAKRATLHLQPIPGEDPAILAAFLHVIVAEGLYDRAFVDENVDGLDALTRAVAPFTPDVVARRADLDAEQIVRAARMFGQPERGYIAAGVGPSFATSSTLVNYLVLCLEVVCGHVLREGEQVERTVALRPRLTYKAQAIPPGDPPVGEKLRVGGLSGTPAGMPTGVLADEILLEGEGQVRALISCGANPVTAWPDQLKTITALKSLELLVQVDPWMAQTARLSHYVIAPKMPYEVPGMTTLTDLMLQIGDWYGPAVSYGQYTPAVMDPPAGSDLIEEWQFFYRLAQRMSLSLVVDGQPIDMEHEPTTDESFALITSGSRISLDDVKAHPHGAAFVDPPEIVQPKDPGWTGRLDVGNPRMMSDLATLTRARRDVDAGTFPFRLIGRRMQRTINSSQNFPATNRGRGYNPAYMHPDDLAALQVEPGDVVEIRSPRASILGVVEADATLRRGLVSMTHGFGDVPERDAEFREIGSPTGRLLDNEQFVDPHVGMPRMGNVAVTVSPVREAKAEV
jgi:anaerobic selenocysteine-containing dehydrogenase